MSLEKDARVKCTIESLAFGGRGVGRVDGMAVFVAGGLPGDEVVARVVRAKKRFAEGVVEEVVTPSPSRVEPECPHFAACGGCAIQDLDYPVQVEQKAAQVRDSLARIGGAQGVTMDDPIPSPAVWRYRNKMEFAFETRDSELHLGLRGQLPAGEKGLAPVLDVSQCHICSERTMDIVNRVREWCRESGVPAFDPAAKQGFWRHLVIRHTSLDQIMVHCITKDDVRWFKFPKELATVLEKEFPDVTAFVHSSRASRSMLAVGEEVEFRTGAKSVEEQLMDGERALRYHISANSFFQTNSLGASELFKTVARYCGLTGSETVLDLYCGAGAIGIFLGDKAGKVIGYEVNEEAVAKAWASAKENGLTNCDFVSGSLEKGVVGGKERPRPDVVVVDPPRSGMHPKTADAILRMRPEKIVAVSCDPSTLARDVKRLSEEYELKQACAVDMFPHTHHIETVALLVRKA